MTDLKKQEQTAVQTVAKQFSAKWEKGADSADAYLTLRGKHIAVDIATLKPRATGQGNSTKPRLRFDKVVLWLLQRLQVTLRKTVPNRVTVLLTITAPIRLPAKTASALEDKIRTLLRQRRAVRDEKHAIHGNRVHLRLLRNTLEGAPKLIGFVHNPDSDPLLLLNLTQDFVARISAKASRRATRSAGERWLLVISAEGNSCLEAYRYIYSKLRTATSFKKVLMVFANGCIEVL